MALNLPVLPTIAAVLMAFTFLFVIIAVGVPFMGTSLADIDFSVGWFHYHVGGSSLSSSDIGSVELSDALRQGGILGVIYVIFAFALLCLFVARIVVPDQMPQHERFRCLLPVLCGMNVALSIFEFANQAHIKNHTWCSGSFFCTFKQWDLGAGFAMYVMAFLLALGNLTLELYMTLRGTRGRQTVNEGTYASL